MRIETLGKKLRKSKDDQMLAFIDGMPVTLQQQLIIKDGTTMRDLIMIVSQQLKIKERLVGRIATGRCNARDLVALARSLQHVGPLREKLDGAYGRTENLKIGNCISSYFCLWMAPCTISLQQYWFRKTPTKLFPGEIITIRISTSYSMLCSYF